MTLFAPRSRHAVAANCFCKRYNNFRPGLTSWILFTIGFLVTSFSEAAIPGVGGTAGTTYLPEGTTSVAIAPGLNVVDTDNVIASATVQITGGFVSADDVLTFTPISGITAIYDNATGTLTLTGVSTRANYQTILRSVRFNNSTSPALGIRTISFSVHDGTDPSNIAIRSLALSDLPVLTGIESGSIAYTEEDPAVTITNSLMVADADNATLSSATVSVGTAAGDILAAVDDFGIVSTYNSVTGILTLTGTATTAQYQSVLRSVTYRNSNSLAPPTNIRTVTFRAHDGTVESVGVTRQITFTAVNDAPVISGVNVTAASYTEDAAAVKIASALVITDESISSATVQITGNLAPDDILSLTGTYGSIAAVYDASTGLLTITGTGTVTNYQNALRNVSYRNSNNDMPSTLTRTIVFQVTDASNVTSNPVSTDLPFIAKNDVPILANLETTPLSYTEDQAPIIGTDLITVTDVDNTTLASATISISSGFNSTDRLSFADFGAITASYAISTGILTLTGIAPIADYVTALRSITYHSVNLLNPSTSTRTIRFVVNDGVGSSLATTRNITFTAVDDGPVLAGIPATDITFAETLPTSTAVTIASNITVADLDGPAVVTGGEVSISKNFVNGDVLSYTTAAGIVPVYDASTGVLTLTGSASAAVYQNFLRTIKYTNSNTLASSPLTRTISFTVLDASHTSNTVTRNVLVSTLETVTTLEEVSIDFPVLVYDPSINASLDVSSITITANPVNGSATVDNSTGIITYTPNAQFSSGPPDVVKFSIKDTNGVQLGTVTYNINVTLINDPPSFVPGPNITIQEDAGAQIFPAWATIIDDGEPFTSQTLTFVLKNDTAAFFSSQPAINRTTGNLTFRTANNAYGTATVKVVLTDNGSNVLPNINHNDTIQFTITVTPVNDGPVANNDTYSTSSVAPLNANLRTTDAEGDMRFHAPVLAPQHGSLILNPSGTFTYTPDASYTGPDSFTYEVCGDTGSNGVPTLVCSQGVINITVNPVNADWNIVGNNSIELAPNSFILTPDLGNQQGAIWNKNPLDLRYSFDLTLNAIFSAEGVVKDSEGADGMVFVFQRDVTPPPLDVPDLPIYARGVFGGSLGVGNITPSFHVEVDTYMNNVTTDGQHQNDPAYDHISVSTNGDVWTYVGAPVPAAVDVSNNPLDIEDGQWHAIKISWDNPTKKLIVNFDGVQKLVVSNDIANQVFGNDPSNVFWGFTASTGGKSNYQALKDIVMTVTNLPPDIGADVVTVDEDVVLSGTSLMANDSDPEGSVMSVLTETKTTAHGSVIIKADGTFVYTPNANYNGSDSFTYQVCDSYSTIGCSIGTVNITVNPVQDAPVATPDVFSTLEDTKLVVTCDCVLINDYDVDGDPLTGEIVETVKHGTIVFQPDGTFEYMPDQDFFGTDTFTYTATDGFNTTDPVLVTINVIPVNDAPIAVNDAVDATEDVPTVLPILTNDSDVDDVLTTAMITITTPPQHGTLQITPEDVIYTSNPDYNGPDAFQYTLKDAAGAVSNTATVTVNVTPVNDMPVTSNDVATTPEDTPTTIDVLANDTDVDNALDPSSVVALTPAHGKVEIQPNGSIVYTPAQDYFGPDSFTYTVKDISGGASLPATVSLTVTPVNDGPVASNDSGSTLENTPVGIPLTENDTDVDNPVNPGTIAIIAPPSHGSVSVNPDGVATYVPDTDYLGDDTFTYTIQDPEGLASQPATVTITVIPPNRAPVAVNDGPITHLFLLDLSLDVLENDYDVDNSHDELVIESVTQPNVGSVSIEGNKIVYHPQGTTSGLVTFTYTIADPAGLTATATVTIEYTYNPLTVSEGFSPNSDNSNDTWYILSIENFPNNSVKVFDRWGLLVYQKAGYENMQAPWDGRANAGQQAGKLLDQGTYYYMLDVGGEIKVLSGFVMITR